MSLCFSYIETRELGCGLLRSIQSHAAPRAAEYVCWFFVLHSGNHITAFHCTISVNVFTGVEATPFGIFQFHTMGNNEMLDARSSKMRATTAPLNTDYSNSL
jgi:hypothetical protein